MEISERITCMRNSQSCTSLLSKIITTDRSVEVSACARAQAAPEAVAPRWLAPTHTRSFTYPTY